MYIYWIHIFFQQAWIFSLLKQIFRKCRFVKKDMFGLWMFCSTVRFKIYGMLFIFVEHSKKWLNFSSRSNNLLKEVANLKAYLKVAKRRLKVSLWSQNVLHVSSSCQLFPHPPNPAWLSDMLQYQKYIQVLLRIVHVPTAFGWVYLNNIIITI